MGVKYPPGFILWVDDFLSSGSIALMTDAEFRAYVILLCRCWQLGCALPDSIERLGQLTGERNGHSVTPFVQGCFEQHPTITGSLTHPKLYKQFLTHLQRSNAGKASGEARNRTKGATNRATDGATNGGTSSNPPILPIDVLEIRNKGNKAGIDYRAEMAYFNNCVAPHLPGGRRIERMTETRKAALKARLTEIPDLWVRVIEEADRLNCFAREKQFIDFDFLMSPSKLEKLLEGKYRSQDSAEAYTSIDDMIAKAKAEEGAL